MQLNYENSHWLFASIDLVRKRWSARDPWKGAPHLERARDDVKTFLCNEKIDEWTEVVSSETGPWQSNGHDCGIICIYYAIHEMFDIDSQHVPVPEIFRRAIHFGMPCVPGHDIEAPFAPRDVLQWMPANNAWRRDPKSKPDEGKDSDKRVVKIVNLMDELHQEHSNLISAIDLAMGETRLVRNIIQKAKEADDNSVTDVQTELDHLQQVLKLLAEAPAGGFTTSPPWQGAQRDGVIRVTSLEKQRRRLEKNRDYRSEALQAVLQGLQEDVRAYEGMKAAENHRWETLRARFLQRWN